MACQVSHSKSVTAPSTPMGSSSYGIAPRQTVTIRSVVEIGPLGTAQDWLRNNYSELTRRYPGQWVAVAATETGPSVVSHGHQLDVVAAKIAAAGLTGSAVFAQLPLVDGPELGLA